MLRPNLEFVPIRIGIRVWMSKCHPVPVWDGKITIVFSHYVHRVTAVGRSCVTVRSIQIRIWTVTTPTMTVEVITHHPTPDLDIRTRLELVISAQKQSTGQLFP